MRSASFLTLIALLLALFGGIKGQVMDDDDEQPKKDPILNYSALESPFRIGKVNILWDKARKKLAEGKLKMLYSDLKVHDKEELTLKKLKAERKDKEGIRENEVRKSYLALLNKYGLSGKAELEPLNDDEVDGMKKTFFHDKRLNRLWEKAEKAGLNERELMTLKEEFKHHELKQFEYSKLMKMAEAENPSNDENKIDLDDSVHEGHNELRGKAKELKKEYQRLHRLATNAHPTDFEDEKVQSLWNLAQNADFNDEELESLRKELEHFNARIHKMRHLEDELKLVDERKRDFDDDGIKTEGRKKMEKKMKKHQDTLDGIEEQLKSKIAARHSEL